MKTILLFLIPLIYSCSKDNCEQCTRVWKYKTYVLTYSTPSQVTEYEGATEKFTACGKDMIEAEEQIRTTYSKTPVPNQPNKWNVVEGTGTCNCN